MTKNNKSLHFYSCIFDNFDILKNAGILSNKRIEEIKNYCAKDKFEPTVLQDGRKLDNWLTHILSGKVFAQTSLKDSYYWLCNQILVDFLTQEEVDILNEHADTRYSEVKEKERFEKAEKIKESDWGGPVYSESIGYNDGYFANLDEFYEFLEDEYDYKEKLDIRYVWACHSNPSCHIDMDDVLENATQEAHEDFSTDDLKGVKELAAAIDKFNELNKDNVTWTPDYSKVVILDK